MANARGPLVGIEVRIRNAATQQVVVVRTTEGGRYTVAVAPGTYDVFASAPAHATFAHRQVEVAAGAVVKVDGLISESQNALTPGELFFQYVAAERTPPTGKTPRTSERQTRSQRRVAAQRRYRARAATVPALGGSAVEKNERIARAKTRERGASPQALSACIRSISSSSFRHRRCSSR
jgi:hypothetical protein